MRNLIFIGDAFYIESGSVMSSLYEEGTYKRYDWGFVNRDLRNGLAVNIRQATKEEVSIFKSTLKEMLNNKTELAKQSESEE